MLCWLLVGNGGGQVKDNGFLVETVEDITFVHSVHVEWQTLSGKHYNDACEYCASGKTHIEGNYTRTQLKWKNITVYTVIEEAL